MGLFAVARLTRAAHPWINTTVRMSHPSLASGEGWATTNLDCPLLIACQKLLQTKKLCRIHFRHPIDLALSKALLSQAVKE